jgi:hypothetical protein
MPASKRTFPDIIRQNKFLNVKVKDHNEFNQISHGGDGDDADGMRLPTSARGLFSGARTIVQAISYTHLSFFLFGLRQLPWRRRAFAWNVNGNGKSITNSQ